MLDSQLQMFRVALAILGIPVSMPESKPHYLIHKNFWEPIEGEASHAILQNSIPHLYNTMASENNVNRGSNTYCRTFLPGEAADCMTIRACKGPLLYNAWNL